MECKTLERVIQSCQTIKSTLKNGLFSVGIMNASIAFAAPGSVEESSRLWVAGYGEVESETYWGSYCGDYPTILKEDHNNNGFYEEIHTYWCNAEGTHMKRATEALDKNEDGNPDEIVTLEYDAQKNLTRHSWDHDGDGKSDEILIYEYDAQGNAIRSTRTLDNNEDGNPDKIKTNEFIPLYIGTNSFPYMFPARETVDRNGDGRLDEITTHEYDAQGHEIRYTIDSNGDGKPDTIFTNEYDAQGHPVESHIYDIRGYPSGKINTDGTLTERKK